MSSPASREEAEEKEILPGVYLTDFRHTAGNSTTGAYSSSGSSAHVAGGGDDSVSTPLSIAVAGSTDGAGKSAVVVDLQLSLREQAVALDRLLLSTDMLRAMLVADPNDTELQLAVEENERAAAVKRQRIELFQAELERIAGNEHTREALVPQRNHIALENSGSNTSISNRSDSGSSSSSSSTPDPSNDAVGGVYL